MIYYIRIRYIFAYKKLKFTHLLIVSKFAETFVTKLTIWMTDD